MNKIGFRIYRFKEGPSVGLTVNEGDWTKKVVDIRDILKLYNSEGESKFAMFMSFSENGAYITIARPISGRGGDNTAAWIYIPNNIEVSGVDILPIIDVVKEELSASKGNTERLSKLFTKEYREVEVAAYVPSSSEMVFAKRNTIFYQLKDILGKKIYQPIYSNYHAVLIETQDGMEVVDKNVVDISTTPLEDTFVFCPPAAQDLPHGVTVHFSTPGYPQFKRPIRKNKGETVDLIFNRRGFDSIPFMTSVEENNQICGVPRFDWKKAISRDLFKVVAAHDANINLTNDASITVNNEELKWHQPITLSEHDALQAKVRIKVNGYESAEDYFNLLNAVAPIKVELHRAERAQSWKIELANGHTAVMDLRSKYLSGDKYESPIKGYSREDGVLRYTNFGVFKQRAIGFLMAVATFVVICLGVALFEWFDNHNFEWQLGLPPIKVEKIGAYKAPSVDAEGLPTNNEDQSISPDQGSADDRKSLLKAIAYLDNEIGTWQRDSLTFYPDLEHLFEELNTYEIDNLLKRASSLQDSSQFRKVLDAISANSEKILANKDKDYKKFCQDGDYTITVTNYINKLNKPIEQKNVPASEGVASKAAKNAKSNPSGKDNKNNSSKKNSNRGGV